MRTRIFEFEENYTTQSMRILVKYHFAIIAFTDEQNSKWIDKTDLIIVRSISF